MVQVDPIQVPSAAAYEKYVARSCVLSSEQSRGFKCGICLELLSEPVSTPCGHNFCSECLRHAMVCAPRSPLCREQLQGPFRVNHVLEDMISLLQIQSPQRPSPALPPWKAKSSWGQEAQHGSRGRSQLPTLVSPRHPLQQLPNGHLQTPRTANVSQRPPSATAAGGEGSQLPPLPPLPLLVPQSVPQALVPIQYTRRVPTEVPSLDQAIREALPGTLVLLARGTHQLATPLMISRQIRIKGEGSASEVQLVCSGACGVLVDRGGYALVSSVTIHHVRANRGLLELGEPAPGMACAVRVSGAGSRLLLDHCEVLADGIGVAATDDSRLDMQFTRVHDCKAHGVCVQSNAKACVEECCLEQNAGSGIHADGSTLEARRNTICHNMHAGVQLLGRCCGSIKYNKMYENRRKNVALSRVPWWARGSIKILSNLS